MKCAICKEEVQAGAVKCKYCGAIIDKKGYQQKTEELKLRCARQPSLAGSPAVINPEAVASDKPQSTTTGRAQHRGTLIATTSIGLFTLLVVLGLAFGKPSSYPSPSASSSSANKSPSPSKNSYKKSDRQVIQDWARAMHGRNAIVDIQSGYYGGAYQVTVRVQIHGGIYDGGYDRYTYTVLLDESAQRVQSAELVEQN